MPNRRNEQHRTDTLARYKVPATLPEEWEWRESTGRDYGTDMEVEPFEDGETLGRILLLQIKGTRKSVPVDNVATLAGFKTSTIRYAERFVSPIVVTFCPVNADPPTCRFIWLQKYARVALSVEVPNWRTQGTVTLRFPVENRLPDAWQRLRYIANHPARLESWGSLARIQNDVRLLGFGMDPANIDLATVAAIRNQYHEAQQLPGLFDDDQNGLAQVCHEEAIVPCLTGCGMLMTGPPYDHDGVAGLRWDVVHEPQPVDDEQALVSRIRWGAEQLSAYLAVASDVKTAQGAWQQHGVHDF